MECDFEFKPNIKYPSIPCYIDETTTVYPVKGKGIITGSEYILARNQGCKFNMHYIYYLPFSDLQAKRNEYPKGDINNLMYKEINNSIYGSLVRGMSDKRSDDIKSGKMIRMTGTELSNPILAS